MGYAIDVLTLSSTATCTCAHDLPKPKYALHDWNWPVESSSAAWVSGSTGSCTRRAEVVVAGALPGNSAPTISALSPPRDATAQVLRRRTLVPTLGKLAAPVLTRGDLHGCVRCVRVRGARWTRTTDLILIRDAL